MTADVVFGQPPFDLLNDWSAFLPVGFYRLPIDQLVKLTIATVVPLGTTT
jgi:hypothetical protein